MWSNFFSTGFQSSKMQPGTQGYNRRPYGVGLLVAGYDDKGPHIFQVSPRRLWY
jgi:20S proteasome subunit alpha 6